jgi:hypothetical protein
MMTDTTPSRPEYRLDVGGVIIALVCPQPGLAKGLAAWFGRASADDSGPPQVTLEVTVVPHDDQPSFPRSLLTSKRLLPTGGGGFDIADGLITGWYDRTTSLGAVRVKAALMTGRLTRIFEQILYQAHASARQRLGQPAWLIHSSAVIAGGQGFLFVGPSGAGKSTVARLSAGLHVLGDEMSLVRPGPQGWELVGTPFNGTFRDKQPGVAPLRAILLLEHGAEHALADVTPSEAVAFLAGEIVPPVGLDEVPGPTTLPAMVDAAQLMVANTALKFLRFRPDAGFWSTLAAGFGLPDGIRPTDTPTDRGASDAD